MKLSKNFSLEEFTYTTHDVDNTPNDEQIDNLILLCSRILEPVRDHFQSPVIITSGFRCSELNKLIGGAFNSQHMRGEAADFNVRGVANDQVWKWISQNLDFDQLIGERLSKKDGKAGWTHCSVTHGHNRNDAISFVGYGVYKPGLVYV